MFSRSFGWVVLCTFISSLAFLSTTGYGDGSRVIYVNASATGANTGTSWADAYTSLQMALDMSTSGTEIWVAAGTYKPTKMVGGTGERFRAFQLKNGVGLYGGFKGTEVSLNQRSWFVNRTILTGDLNGNDNDNLIPSDPTRQDNCYHVFNHLYGTELDVSAVLDGFTVSGGNGTDSYYYGGGMYNDHCSPTITHCTFQSNLSIGSIVGGGAILNYNKSNPTIDHCVFTRNYSSSGGGIFNSSGSNPKISNCIFNNNLAGNGGGICNDSSSVVITDTSFIGNTVTSTGGGVNSYNNSTITVMNCIFADNSGLSAGGMFNSSSSIKIINSVFTGNSTQDGGGMYNYKCNPAIIGCTISGNTASKSGGGIYNSSANPTITNSIIWGNMSLSGPQLSPNSGSATIAYSDIQGGWTGTGNINLDPLFVDMVTEDFRLQYDSPCIDAGNNASVPAGVSRDLAGNMRIADGNYDGAAKVDMGAYEINIPANMVTPPTFTPSGGSYNTEQSVKITCGIVDAVIHYTTNGKEPTENDSVIASGASIMVDRTMMLKSRAWKGVMIPSMVRSANYNLTVSTPGFSVGGGTYNTEQTVTVTCATPGAVIHYTTNGGEPTQNDPSVVSGSKIAIDRSMTLQARAWKGAMTPSEVRSSNYDLIVSTPVFSLGSGIYTAEKTVTVTCATPGAAIHYTTDGSDPTENDPTIESGSTLEVDRSMTLNVKAWKGAMTPSAKVSARYEVVVAVPSFSKASGTYNTEQFVEAYCSTPGATIHYTTNGMSPTEADPVIVSGGIIFVDRSMVLKIKAWKGMMTPSSIIAAKYEIVVATPSVSISSGTYTMEQTSVVSCATPGATIHYTTDGNEPTRNDPVIASGSTVYIDHNQTLKARAWKENMDPSNVATAVYQLTTAMPEFTPDGNAFSEDQQVTITCATPGAAIYYTLDGSDPLQAGTVIEHGGKIIVSIEPATTLKAAAYKPNFQNSDIRTAVYRQTYVIYVNAHANGNNTGGSWADAYPSLQTALDKAVPGDEIWVAAGTYKPTKMVGGTGERFKAFQMKNGVGLYGGFNGTEIGRNQRNWDLNKTILSGDLNGDDNSTLLPTEPTRQDNCYHVFNHLFGTALNRSAVMDGFIITGGNGNVHPHHYGGGMYNDQSSPTVRRCTFIENTAWWVSGTQQSGGAMMNYNNSSPLIDSCTFIRNYAEVGAGIFNMGGTPTIINSIFRDNTAIWGGAIYGGGGIITNCVFFGNSASSYGGAIISGNNLTMMNCILWNNTASSSPQISYGSGSTVIYNDIQGGGTGTGNINKNPLFADAAAGDFRLQAGSPCIDMGNNAGVPEGILTDYAGNSRIIDGNEDNTAVVDMGAHEYLKGSVFPVILTPPGGFYHAEQTVIVTCSIPGAVIHYTNDGQDPTENDPVIASGDHIVVDRSLTLKTRAWVDHTPSAVIQSATYTLITTTPVFSVSGGTYPTEQVITVTCATPGAEIHYTTNGQDPTQDDPIIASGDTILVDQSMILKARAWKGAMLPSEVKSASYALIIATPVFSVAQGTYHDEQFVQIFCTTPGVEIHYTTSGVDPTESDPVIASGDTLFIDHSLTLKAAAWRAGIRSDIASAVYSLMAAMPEFTPNGGVYKEQQSVTIQCSTPGATIYYTTDGTNPSQDSAIFNPGQTIPISLNPYTVLKAIAYKGNLQASDIGTAVYRTVGVVYVNASAGGGNAGTSWANAYSSLQTALDTAVSGDEIWVAAGTYKPTKMVGGTGERFRAFQLKNGVKLYGGFNGTETCLEQREWESNQTILSGDLNGNDTDIIHPDNVSRKDNCYHVFNHLAGTSLGSSAILDGFVVTGGNGTDSYPYGGGMYNDQCSPTINHCTFIANTASDIGGAILNYNNSVPVINHCVFIQNYTGLHGGGVCNYESSSPTIINCSFFDNRAAYGGGVYGGEVVTNCIFSGNSAECGGALASISTMINCLLVDNKASYGGAIDHIVAVINCVFTGNSAVRKGGAIYNASMITNCILWDNTAPIDSQIYAENSSNTLSYSNIEGGWTGAGTNNINLDPLFVDAANGDFHLRPDSPCLDKGNNSAVPANVMIDLDGCPRKYGRVDMGCYEYTLPIARAGQDQSVHEWADVKLDGSGSRDSDGDALTYRWMLNGKVIAAEAKPTVSLPAGIHTITLVVSDGVAESEPDEVVVTVFAARKGALQVVPSTLSRSSTARYVVAMFQLPSGVQKLDGKLVLYPGKLDSALERAVTIGGKIQMYCWFEKQPLVDAIAADGTTELTIVGRQPDGQYVYARTRVTITK